MISVAIDNLGRLLGAKTGRIFIAIICLAYVLPLTAHANRITPQQTVEQALMHSRQLEALGHNQQAAQLDLQQSRNRYLPSVDLQLGYGVDQHSDETTRRPDADPSDSDWDNRSNASVTLTQNLYTGGEIGQQIRIRKALLESSQKQQQSTRQTVILDALTAHLDIYRQRELVALAQRNLDVHQDIYRSLEERAQAGSGNLADVSQAKARLARAQSSFYINKSELAKALVSYARLVGTTPDPDQISYVETPSNLPTNLEDALQRMEKQNPDLLTLKTTLDEAEARVGLAQASFKPKLDLQLSSRYSDNIEGDKSWQNTNEAMLNLRWNLFNGGQDKAGKHAALARKMQSKSVWEDKRFELRETTAATWETYQSLQNQKAAYKDAAEFSRETFEAYLSQFSISQRSLLDILSAESDYFQSASQLINVTVNQTIIAYRLLALTGELNDLQFTGAIDNSDEFKWLQQRPEVPSTVNNDTEQQSESIELTDEETLGLFIDNWAGMWSDQDISGYLDSYSERFVPEKGQSYESWQNSRRKALTAPVFIELTISDLQLLKQTDQSYLAIFNQRYQSDRYQDRVRKTLTLERQAQKWRIVREQERPIAAQEAPQLSSNDALIDPDTENPATTIVEIGPCVTAKEIGLAKNVLSDLMIEYTQRTGPGLVKIVRLYEGSYPAEEAKVKLRKVRETVDFAFLLADENRRLGLYLGSFHEKQRAENFSKKLRQMGIESSLVETQVEMPGTFMRTDIVADKTGQILIEQITKYGLVASIIE